MNLGMFKTLGGKVGNFLKTNYGQNTLQKDLSSGNKFKDFGLGALSGLSSNSNQKGFYMPTFNYAGNGLAETSMDYLYNRDYFNPYDASNAISAVLKRRANNEQAENNKQPNTLGRLGGLFRRRRQQAGGFDPVNTMSDYIGNEVNGSPLRPESTMDYLKQETNYGGYTPQFLPSSLDNVGNFDFSLG